MTIGIYLLLFLLSLILTIVIEYPIRIFIKWLTRNKLQDIQLENNINPF